MKKILGICIALLLIIICVVSLQTNHPAKKVSDDVVKTADKKNKHETKKEKLVDKPKKVEKNTENSEQVVKKNSDESRQPLEPTHNESSGSSSGSASNNFPPIPAEPTPVEPNYVCPTVPRIVVDGQEMWDGDPFLPCDFCPIAVGNVGIEFSSTDEAYAYAYSQGWAGNEYSLLHHKYNGGWETYSLNYVGK